MTDGPLPVVLLLPGQGAQHQGMATGLYRDNAEFAELMDSVFDAFGPLGSQIRADWLADRPDTPIWHVTRSTPLLFAIDYALSVFVQRRGVRPVALLGHSAGELAAAVLADIFTLTDAAGVLVTRVLRMSDTPPGGLLAVAAGAAQIREILGWRGLVGSDGVAVAAINAPGQTVLAGLDAPLAEVSRRLSTAGLTVRPVPAGTAFHSPALADLAVTDRELFVDVPTRPPRIPVCSGYLGGPLTVDAIRDPAFWASHPAAPVLFWPALRSILDVRDVLFLECGPGQELSTLARRHPAIRRGDSKAVALLPPKDRPGTGDLRSVLTALEAAGIGR